MSTDSQAVALFALALGASWAAVFSLGWLVGEWIAKRKHERETRASFG